MGFCRGLLLSLVVTAVGHAAAQQPFVVLVYRDRFEVAGHTFDTIEGVRIATRGLDLAYSVRECGAEERVKELLALFAERARGQFTAMRQIYPLDCPKAQ